MYKSLEALISKTENRDAWLAKLKKLEKLNELDTCDSLGSTPLGVSAYFGHLPGLKFLLNSGANVNTRNRDGETPLLSAMSSAQTHGCIHDLAEVIVLLIDRGADVNAADLEGCTALMHAVSSAPTTDFVQRLVLAGANVNLSDQFGRSALMRASELKDFNVFESLVRAGADIHAQDTDGRNVLFHWLAYVKSSGYGLNYFENSIAATRQVMAFLLERGADLHTFDTDRRRSLLHVSALSNYPEMVRRCLKEGLDPHAKDADGYTPLMLACQGASVESLSLLLSTKPNVDFKSPPGKPILGWLKKGNAPSHREIISLLQQHALLPTPKLGVLPDLITLCKNGDVEAVKESLKAGVDVNTQSRYGKTALMTILDSSYYGDRHREIFDLLLADKDLDLNIQSKIGMTALMYACKQTLVEHYFPKRLVERGAKVDALNNKGLSAPDFVKYDSELENYLRTA